MYSKLLFLSRRAARLRWRGQCNNADALESCRHSESCVPELHRHVHGRSRVPAPDLSSFGQTQGVAITMEEYSFLSYDAHSVVTKIMLDSDSYDPECETPFPTSAAPAASKLTCCSLAMLLLMKAPTAPGLGSAARHYTQ